VRRGLDRRSEELRHSIEKPHPEGHEFADLGFEEWSRGLPDEDAETLLDNSGGKAVEWLPGAGATPAG